MQEQRHVELGRGVEDRPEPLVRQVGAAHVGGDVAADETEVAHAAAQLGRRRLRVLHRQERPGRKPLRIRGDKRRVPVVAEARGPRRQRSVEGVVDQWGRQRDHAAGDAEAVHPRDLQRRLEESAVEPVTQAAALEIDRLPFPAEHAHLEFGPLPHQREEFIGNEMAVDVGDHGVQSPRYATLSRSSRSNSGPLPCMTMRPFSIT